MNELGKKMIEALKHGTAEDRKRILEEIKKKYGSAEFFTVDEHGRVTDAPLHGAMEAADEEAMLAATRERVRRLGIMSEEMIQRKYGKPRAKEGK
jgi:hypothetical protein